MTDHLQEQEMEIEALEAILMDEFKEIHSGESGLNTSNRCFQITLSPQDDDTDQSTTLPVLLALIFSHTEEYPDEPPLLNVKSIRGIQVSDLKVLKEKLEQEASENLGMAMIYTLVTSAKEWLSERYGQDVDADNVEEEESTKDEVIIPHGEPVTVDTFLAWRERFEAELALERAKLMPESALTAPPKRSKKRKMTEDGKNRGGVTPNLNPQSQYQYGTFQGVANYYHPHFPQQPPPQPFVGLPHAIPPPGCAANPYVHGYQTVTGFPVEEPVPLRQPRLPVCGLGMGWLLFFLGFFFGGIPWYVGTFILLCVKVDYREKAGYLACAIASVIAMIAITFGLTKGGTHAW